MEIAELINHPERLDRDTLYELRSLLALYPYYQPVRLLMLKNLYLLHDPTFDEELRRAAIYVTDRRVLFDMVEAAHYQLQVKSKAAVKQIKPEENRTLSLIDNFLDQVPKDDDEAVQKKRKPTPADAAIDYVAYLLQSEDDTDEQAADVPEMRGQALIDTFINTDKGKIVLPEELPEEPPAVYEVEKEEEDTEGEYFTETLARIYVKQGRYSKALEIIQRLSLQVPKKNAYFADQIRFLEKLIINNKKK